MMNTSRLLYYDIAGLSLFEKNNDNLFVPIDKETLVDGEIIYPINLCKLNIDLTQPFTLKNYYDYTCYRNDLVKLYFNKKFIHLQYGIYDYGAIPTNVVKIIPKEFYINLPTYDYLTLSYNS